MAKHLPDFSFERGGQPLRSWLLELVDEDASTRLAAGEALQAMSGGVPTVNTDLEDIEWAGAWRKLAKQSERFADEVRLAVASPGFAAADFVRKLILYSIALDADLQARSRKITGRNSDPETYANHFLGWLEGGGDEGGRFEGSRRYLRGISSEMARSRPSKTNSFIEAEVMTSPGLMAHSVFTALDVALLADRPALRAMLGTDSGPRRSAIEALARIGPPAVDFADLLFAELDDVDDATDFSSHHALGAIGAEDSGVIDGLLHRLRTGSTAVRGAVALTLAHMRPPLAGRAGEAIELLRRTSHEMELYWQAIGALASVGRDDASVCDVLIELASPRPPRWRSSEDHPDDRTDEVMWERGYAIQALHHFRAFADRVVPALIDAFDTYEEFDPDWTCDGHHERACWSLQKLGPLARPAVPRLLRELDDWAGRPELEREWPKDIFRVFAAIGPAASEALPALEQFRVAHGMGPEAESELNPLDSLDRAILALRGEDIG